MLELNRTYTKAEMADILGTNDRQGMQRKLSRYGVVFSCSGRGDDLVFKVLQILRPFKLYAILDLGFDANTDFLKLAHFYYYYFNDDEFMAMPDEVKETRMRLVKHNSARQTITKYTARLFAKDLVHPLSGDYIYYFAHKHNQIITDKETYCKAWREYWAAVHDGKESPEAIYDMKVHYGGVARKQARPGVNAFYKEEIDILCQLVLTEIDP